MRFAHHGWFLLALLLPHAVGCAPRTATVRAPATESLATTDAAWAEATEAYRPPTTRSALATLEKNPMDPTAYAVLADAFAGTDAAGMSVLYALYYRAMGTDCASDAQAALAVARVLAQRIRVSEVAEGRFAYEARLAPEPAPTRVFEDGRERLPLATRLASSLAAALPGHQGHATIAEYHGILSRWVEGPVDLGSANELHAWLVATKKAGHLEAFSHLVFGLAFPEEFKKYEASREKELRAALAYFETHLLVPTRAPYPDATD